MKELRGGAALSIWGITADVWCFLTESCCVCTRASCPHLPPYTEFICVFSHFLWAGYPEGSKVFL